VWAYGDHCNKLTILLLLITYQNTRHCFDATVSPPTSNHTTKDLNLLATCPTPNLVKTIMRMRTVVEENKLKTAERQNQKSENEDGRRQISKI
jgi:hypothetical protein